MPITRAELRVAHLFALAWALVSLAGCSRAAVASLLPSLSLGVVTRRLAHEAALEGRERWDTLLLVGLHFRARSRAAELPARGELAPETWIAPCDAEDVICLQEAAEAERELGEALGELQ